MKRMIGFVVLGLAVCVLLPATATSAPPPESTIASRVYTFETIDPPYGVPGIDLVTQWPIINNSGVVSVQYQIPPSPDWYANERLAVLRGGDWTKLDVPGAVSSTGCVNDNGMFVLNYQLAGDPVWYAAYYCRGRLTPFPEIPGYPGGILVEGFNNRGQISAIVIAADGSCHGFVGDAQEYAVFDPPGSVYTQPGFLNDAGVTVGFYTLADGSYHKFKWENGEISDISGRGVPYAINNAGVMVGVYYNPYPRLVGYVQDGDEFVEFNVPGSTFTMPNYMNDHGQISGQYGDADGVPHGFIATWDYTFQTVDYPGKPDKDFNGYFTQTTGLNDSGLIVQAYTDTAGYARTAVFNGKEWTVINVPGSVQTSGAAPNSQGQVPLLYAKADGIWHWAIWRRGHFTLLPDVPGYAAYNVDSMNDRGQISGGVIDSSGAILALVMDTDRNSDRDNDRDNHRDNHRDNDRYWVFAAPGSAGVTYALCTCNSGITVGTYMGSDGFHPFIFDGKQFLNFDAPYEIAVLNYINDEGEMVGGHGLFAGNAVGFLFVKGTWSDFNLPNALQTTPWMINDKHEISGTYQAADGTCHGFIATPKHGPKHCPK